MGADFEVLRIFGQDFFSVARHDTACQMIDFFFVDMLKKIVSFSYYWPENGPSAPKWALKAQFCVFFHRVLFSLRQHDRADRIPPRKIGGKMWCSGLIIYKPRLIMWCFGLKMWCSGLII